jgi:HSP20 family protein
MAITRFDPFDVFDRLLDFDFNNLLAPGTFPLTSTWGVFEGDWSPRLDLFENDDAYYVKVDVPGMDAKDIDLNVTNDVLTIKGARKAGSGERREGERYQREERMYGSFHRTLPMRTPVDADHVDAKLKNGVLYITLPKREETKPKKINVSVS